MTSIIDGLLAQIRADPRVAVRSGPRQDLGVLLFSQREAIAALYKAAEAVARPDAPGDTAGDAGGLEKLRAACDALRPYFGERN
jgi:hypothetical protein